MFDVLQRDPRRTLIVLGLVGLITTAYLLITVRYTLQENDGNIGALLDDTWIHVRFADHISEGKGLAYNEGELTAGATSPLWVLLLAIPFAIFDPSIMQQVDIAIVMSAIGHVMSVIAITGFGWWITRQAWIGTAAGIVTALTGRYVWMGLTGMEITTFTTLCILSIWSHLHDLRQKKAFSTHTGILLALTTLGRPEAYLLTVLVGSVVFFIIPIRDFRRTFLQEIWVRCKQSWRGILGYILLAGTYPLVCLIISGNPLPNTFRAKSQLGRESPELPRTFFWMMEVDHGKLFIALAILGTSWLFWKALRRNENYWVWATWPSLFILGVLFLGAERYVVNHSRYIAPSIPFMALAAVIGIWAISQNLRSVIFSIGMTSILAITTLMHGQFNVKQVANDVKQLRAMHVQAGYWFREATEPTDSIALNDVGAIVHISNRRVIDLEGLVTPKVIEATRNTPDHTCEHDLQLARILLKDPPLFIGVFPWFYECLISWPSALQPYHQFVINGPTVLAGGEMVIYWPVWENWPMQAAIPSNAIPIEAHFEEGIELAAYQTQVIETGLEVTLWWKAHGTPSGNHHVFVHLVGNDGNLIQLMDEQNNLVTLQHDSEPQQLAFNKQFSMSWWREDDIIRDMHLIQWNDVSIFRQQGLSLNIGVYRYPSGVRLQVSGGGDFVNLPALNSLSR